MAGAIWKYTLTDAVMRITAPIQRFLSVGQQQNGAIVVWALVDDSQPARTHVVRAYNTGEWVSLEDGAFLGTVQIAASPSIEIVWHIWHREEA